MLICDEKKMGLGGGGGGGGMKGGTKKGFSFI